MASVGSVFLSVGVKSDALGSGLKAAERKVARFGATVGRTLTAPFRGLTGVLAVPGAAIGGFVRPLRDLANSIPFVGGALAAALGGGAGIGANIQEQMGHIVQTSREATALGVSTEDLAGIQRLAGPSAEGFSHSLFRLSHELGDAAGGSMEAQNKFSQLGLDWKELRKLSPVDSFGKVNDAIAKLPGGLDQASAAWNVYGRASLDSLPAILRGSQGLKDMTEAAKKNGTAFSQLDATQVIRATQAIANIKEAVRGAFTQAAIGISPYIEGVGKWFTDLLEKAGGIGPLMRQGFAMAGRALALFLDDLGEVVKGLKEIGATVKSLRGDGAGPVAGVASSVASSVWHDLSPVGMAVDWMKGEGRFGEQSERPLGGDPVRKWLAKAAGIGAESDDTGKGLDHPVDRPRLQLISDLTTFEKGLGKSLQTIGFTASQKTLFDMTWNREVPDDLRGGIADKMKEARQSDIFNQGLSEFQSPQQTKLASGAEANTVEAQSLLNRFAAQGFQSADPVARLNAILDALTIQDRHRQKEAQQLRDAFKAGMPEVRGM